MKLVIGFSRPKSGLKPFAHAIMMYQGTDYSHVYLRFRSDSLERDLIYQASSTMINFMGAILFESEEVVVAEYELEIPEDKKKALMQYLVDNAGKPYAVTQLLGMLLDRSFNIQIKCLSNGDSEMVCSELVARILSGLNVSESFSNFDYVLPVDVRHLCDANPQFTRLR